MNKSISTFSLIMVSMVIVMAGYAQTPVSMQTQKTVKAETMINAGRGGNDVLVIRDLIPWGCDVTVPILISLGANVSTATSATYPALDFSLFGKIVVESAQDASFYSFFEANLAKFETYVNNGGVLEINATDFGVQFNLPGGAISIVSYSGNGYHAMPGHPLLAGVPDPFFGGWANHNTIANLPPGAEIITRTVGGNEPTTAVYGIGTGTVIVSTLTLEIAYYYESNGMGYFNFSLPMYPTLLGYMLQPGPPVETPVSNWALIIGIALIATVAIIRFRRIV